MNTDKIYNALNANYSFHNDNDAAIADALADLLHLCDEYGVDFEEQRQRARRNYLAELAELAELAIPHQQQRE